MAGEVNTNGRELLDAYPFLFEGLSEDEIEIRIDYFTRLHPGDIHEEVRKLVAADSGPPCEPEAVAYAPSIDLLLGELRRVCKQAHCEQRAEEASYVIDCLRSGALKGATRGEQRASALYRHPGIYPRLENDARKLRSGVAKRHVLGHLREVRDFDRVRNEIERVIPATKRERERNTNELWANVRRRFVPPP